MRGATAAGLILLGAALAGAQEPEKGYLQPSVSVFGISEHAGGPAYSPPNDRLSRDLAPAFAAGLDARRRLPTGWLQASAFAFSHDPFSDDGRGLFAAGRLRASLRLGPDWRLLVDDSARLQRRGTGPLSDFQRNDVVLGFERIQSGGGAVGIRIGDRRRGVEDAEHLGFERQSLAGSMTWGLPGGDQWRLEVGPQRYATRAKDGWRLAVAGEWAGRAARWSAAVRVSWLEPLDGLGRSQGVFTVADAPASPIPVAQPGVPTPTPAAPLETPAPTPPALPPVPPDPRTAVKPETQAPALREPLLGPSLIVDPLEDDEGDWDFGRRKQEIVAFFSRTLGRYALTAELRADVERGPDLLAPGSPDVRRERLAARLHLRRTLGSHWVVLGQAGWQRVHDNRPSLGYSRGLFSIGLELRP